MKKYSLFIVPITSILLSGCLSLTGNLSHDESKQESNQEVVERSYDEVSDKHIFWNDIFKQIEDTYYVYLYSLSCSHCNSIKEYMIEKGLNNSVPIYFVSSSYEHNVATEGSVNVSTLSELFIKGYPTLLKIESKMVIKNLAGVILIKEELSSKNV